jgi:hypothetical protein
MITAADDTAGRQTYKTMGVLAGSNATHYLDDATAQLEPPAE